MTFLHNVNFEYNKTFNNSIIDCIKILFDNFQNLCYFTIVSMILNLTYYGIL